MGDTLFTKLITAASRLDMPMHRDHVAWVDRTRREKVIIVMFYGVMLALVINIVGWIAFLCVFNNHHTYSQRRIEQTPAKSTVSHDENSTI